MFEPTTKSAIEYACQDKLWEWIHEYLCGEGDNQGFSDGLKERGRYYHNFATPKLMNLGLFKRCYGTEPDMKFRIPEDDEDQIKWFWENVNGIAERYKAGDWDMPPLIVRDDNGIYELNDGNHRYEALKKLNISEYWVIIWKTPDEEIE